MMNFKINTTTVKLAFSILLFSLLSFNVVAQENRIPEEKREMIKAKKIEFLKSKLALTPLESENFWALYTEFQKRFEDNRKQMRRKIREIKKGKNLEDLTDKEIETIILTKFETREKGIGLRKEYFYRLKETLPMKKVATYFKAEKEFRKKLFHTLKNKNQHRK